MENTNLSGLALIDAARECATEAHKDQNRKYNGKPYITHPRRVADRMADLGWPPEVVAAAWLHDVVEDCEVTLDQLRERFGERVALLVGELTNPSKGSKAKRAERKSMDREHIAKASEAARVVKLVDRIDNLREMTGCDPGFWKVYAEESRLLAEAIQGDGLIANLRQELFGVIAQPEIR